MIGNNKISWNLFTNRQVSLISRSRHSTVSQTSPDLLLPPGRAHMSPDPAPLNPSQTVERIREILVGRHLERLEQRVALLEITLPPTPAASTLMDERHHANETSLATLTENVQRLVDSNRDQIELRFSQHQQETQRLAVQIQNVAATKSREAAPPAVHQLERKLGTWLTDWQSSLQVHLHDRDRRLTSDLRNEVATLRETTESKLARLDSRTLDRDAIEDRFNRIALAARVFAESVSTITCNPGSAPR